jgi:hypothetical protein
VEPVLAGDRTVEEDRSQLSGSEHEVLIKKMGDRVVTRTKTLGDIEEGRGWR